MTFDSCYSLDSRKLTVQYSTILAPACVVLDSEWLVYSIVTRLPFLHAFIQK